MTEIWTPEHPCIVCGATSNTGHSSGCSNFGLYDAEGNVIPVVPEEIPEGEIVPIANECFTNGKVISFKGENYYKGCDTWVHDNPDGGASHCVKPVEHNSKTHESMDGETRLEESEVTDG